MDINVSLTTNLHDDLSALLPILPPETEEKLVAALQQPTIPYSLVLQLSQWSRQPASKSLLTSVKLDPLTYGMVPLLAGTTTSPEKHFPPYTPTDTSLSTSRQKEAVKQITTLINAMLSIIGAGVGAWVIAKNAGWKNEWRVLLGLGVAIAVAVSEAGLYIIYLSRGKSSPPKVDKKDEPPDVPLELQERDTSKEEDDVTSGLRRRIRT